MRSIVVALAVIALWTMPAAADDGYTFRRTTPRASFTNMDGTLVLGVPGGRAWGLESELRPLPGGGVVLVRLDVGDAAVREAFVRVAYYQSPRGRPRQIETVDSELVGSGDEQVQVVRLDPPPDAVAYRLRVLARLVPGADRSRAAAIEARIAHPRAGQGGLLLSRLLPDAP